VSWVHKLTSPLLSENLKTENTVIFPVILSAYKTWFLILSQWFSKYGSPPLAGREGGTRDILEKLYIKIELITVLNIIALNSFLGFLHSVVVGDVADVSELHSVVEVLDLGNRMVIVASPGPIGTVGRRRS
jgi:hypothetical protein